jgi:hypothetical protein
MLFTNTGSLAALRDTGARRVVDALDAASVGGVGEGGDREERVRDCGGANEGVFRHFYRFKRLTGIDKSIKGG